MKNNINKILKNLYKYDNYRNFLKDFFQEQKRLQKSFSYRFFANKSGFSSPSFFINVAEGKRNLTDNSLSKMINGLSLEKKESEYFKYLVKFNQAKNIEEKELYFKKMEIYRYNSKFFKINSKQFSYFKEWYYPVVRELCSTFDWDEDYKLLADLVRPKISIPQAKKAIEILLEVGLIEKKNGQYKQVNTIVTDENIPTFVKKDMRKNVLLKGLEAAEIMSPEERHVSFATVGLSMKTYDEVTKLLNEVRKKVLTESGNEENVEKVFNMVLELYPVSNQIRK